VKDLFRKIVSSGLVFVAISWPGPTDWVTKYKNPERTSFSQSATTEGGVKLGWAKTTANEFDPPLYQDGIYYFTEKWQDGYSIKAVRKSDKFQLWQYDGIGKLGSTIELYLTSILIPSDKLICLNIFTGQVKWEKTGTSAGLEFRQLAINGSYLYGWEQIGSNTYKFYSSYLNTGATKWSRTFAGISDVQYPSISFYGDIYAVYNGIDGQVRILSFNNFGNFSVIEHSGQAISPLILSSGDFGFYSDSLGKIIILNLYEFSVINELDYGSMVSVPTLDKDDAIVFLSFDLITKQVNYNSIFVDYDPESEDLAYIYDKNSKAVAQLNISNSLPDLIFAEKFAYFPTGNGEVWRISTDPNLKKYKISFGQSLGNLIYANGEYVAMSTDGKNLYSFTFDPEIPESNILINSPYKTGQEYKEFLGQLHSHYIPDIKIPGQKIGPEFTVNKYKDAGYDFIALTEHNELAQNPNVEGITFIENAEEDTQRRHGNHILAIGIKDPVNEELSDQERVTQINEQDGFSSFSHPNSYWYEIPLNNLLTIKTYNAIEIYNNGISAAGKYLDLPSRENKNPYDNEYSIEKWDSVLSNRKLVYATAGDDFTPNNPGFDGAAIAVFAKDDSQVEIMDNLKSGNFYALQGSKAPRIKIVTDGDQIIVDSNDLGDIKFIGKDGQLLKEDNNTRSSTYVAKGDEIYVRVEVEGMYNLKSWSQPLIVDKNDVKTVNGTGEKVINLEQSDKLEANIDGSLSASMVPSAELPKNMPPWGLFSPVYNFTKNGELIGNAKLTISYLDKKIPTSDDSLSIFTYNSASNIWEKVKSVVDKTEKKVTANLDHFSLYALSSDLIDDKILPNLEIINMDELENVTGSTSLIINATDNNQIFNVSGFLDDKTLIFSDSDYSDGFDQTIDFSNYPVEKHKLTIIATDYFGNKAMREMKIRIVDPDKIPQILILSRPRGKNSCNRFVILGKFLNRTDATEIDVFLSNTKLGTIPVEGGIFTYNFNGDFSDKELILSLNIKYRKGRFDIRKVRINKNC